MSTRLLPSVSRWSRAAICLGLIGSLVAACSVFLDHDANQCDTDADCASLGGYPKCVDHACTASGVGPEGCVPGTPTTPLDFANACGTAACVPFDNCEKLKLCKDTDKMADSTPPPDAAPGGGPTPDADVTGQPSCQDFYGRSNTLVIGGSTAVAGFMPTLAKLLAQNSPKLYLAYQPSGSCTGVDQLFTGKTFKDIAGKQASLYDENGVPTPCTFGTGTTLDVAVSDVFSDSCNPASNPTLYNLDKNPGVAQYLGPIQPMAFVVPKSATIQAISAEYGHYIFGRATDPLAAPYDSPMLHFVRNAGSGTQQMISRAIGVNAAQWWGVDSGSSGKVASTLESVTSDSIDKAIGILSTDVADKERAENKLHSLAFKGTGQICGYYPDSTPFAKDKINVRDGHYSIWGPIHFFVRASGGVPTVPQAGALVVNFTNPGLPQILLDGISDVGFVPPCAMKVTRDTEMGPIKAFTPPVQCGCYFDARTSGGKAPEGCKACTTSADCSADKPACNNGFCEVK